MSAPAYHEWERVTKTLWRCPWCKGVVRSHKRPGPEAQPTDEAERLLELIQNTGKEAAST